MASRIFTKWHVVHRDLKPANIFMQGSRPVVGDFGLCFRLDAESLTETMEVAAARWFGAPELRNGHEETPTPAADVYSLGKLLYWMFCGRVYDRDEQEYEVKERKLANILAQKAPDPATGLSNDRLIHAGAFADDIVSQTVRYQPSQRLQDAGQLAVLVRQTLNRFDSGGRALDLSLPQRCLFCGKGQYKPVAVPPSFEIRNAPPDAGMLPSHRHDVWNEMRNHTTVSLGVAFAGAGSHPQVPLNLVCDYCGNIQTFRWDHVFDAQKRWKP
jgi:serine/threonine protein kinase